MRSYFEGHCSATGMGDMIVDLRMADAAHWLSQPMGLRAIGGGATPNQFTTQALAGRFDVMIYLE